MTTLSHTVAAYIRAKEEEIDRALKDRPLRPSAPVDQTDPDGVVRSIIHSFGMDDRISVDDVKALYAEHRNPTPEGAPK